MQALRVLLVEDDPDVGEMLLFALESADYATELVGTATEARWRVEFIKPDLVIADWRLLEGGDGVVVANEAADLGIKTVVMSGYLTELKNADPRHK